MTTKINRKKRILYLTVAILLYFAFLSAPFILSFWKPSIGTIFSWDNPSVIATFINGITAPLLSFIAIWLTFEAFWVQYESNTNQLNISERQKESGENQMRDIREERFENRYFNFINLLQKQEVNSTIPNVGTSKQAYHFMFYEFKALCYIIHKNGLYKDFEDDERKKLEYSQAFHLFLNGVSKSSVSRITEDSGIDISEVTKLNQYLLNKQKNHYQKGTMPKYLKDYSNKGIILFDGHRLYLIPFYRSFCMTLQFLFKAVDQKIVEQQQSLYLNILLSHFSEHEIALLRIMYLYCQEQNDMFIEDCYKKRVDYFFKEIMQQYIVSKTMNSEQSGFIDI